MIGDGDPINPDNHNTYWSSTQYTNDCAWIQYFSDSDDDRRLIADKINSYYGVRAIRFLDSLDFYPFINSLLSRTITKGSAFSYTITATNSPTSFSASGLPDGLSLNTTTGVISGTPTSVGTYNVAIGATNAYGTGTATLTIFVTAVIYAPVINSSTSSRTITKGSAFSYTITATNNPTSFSASGLPDGLSLNTTTGVISGTPTSVGTYNVTIGAANSAGSDTETLTIFVTAVIYAPVINSSTSLTVTGGSAFSYTITATNNPTSFSASGLPDGLSLNTTTGVISGMLPENDDTYYVTIGATNSAGSDTETLVIFVTKKANIGAIVGGVVVGGVVALTAGGIYGYYKYKQKHKIKERNIPLPLNHGVVANELQMPVVNEIQGPIAPEGAV